MDGWDPPLGQSGVGACSLRHMQVSLVRCFRTVPERARPQEIIQVKPPECAGVVFALSTFREIPFFPSLFPQDTSHSTMLREPL